MLPVAERAGVKLSMHPDDPPITPIRGVSRIMRTIPNYQRLLDMAPSPMNTITLCQGNFTLMTDDLPRAIRGFGKAISFIHFRDVRGEPTRFEETWHDDGKTDMLACMKAYRDIGFDGVLRPDHVPDGRRRQQHQCRLFGVRPPLRHRLYSRAARSRLRRRSMKIALTGGSGIVGAAILDMALARGDEMIVIDRVAPPAERKGVRWIVASTDDYDVLLDAFAGCEAVIHMAALPRPGLAPEHVTHNNNVVGSYNALHAATAQGIRASARRRASMRSACPTAALRTCTICPSTRSIPTRRRSPTASRNGSASSRPMPLRAASRTCRSRA